jgi:dihydroorotase
MQETARGRTAYRNARLLDPESGRDETGALLVEDGKIADLGPGLFADGAPEGTREIDCAGLCLAPGLIDLKVQLREPGEEHKETMETMSLAAAAGGVTTILCLPNTRPVIDNVSVIEFVARRAREIDRVNIFAYGAITRGLEGTRLTEMGMLAQAGARAFTDGTVTVADSEVMRRALSYARTFDLLIVQRAQDPALAEGGAMNEGEVATRLGLPGIPAAAEVILLERDLRLVEHVGGRYHAGPLSTAAAVGAIRRAKDKGLAVSCDTAPHYFALNERAVGNYRTFAKVAPPLRNEADRRAIVEGIRDGAIDSIASDHAPHDPDSKRVPFEQAEAGVVGLETLLPLSLEIYHNGQVPLLDLLRPLTLRPAEILGLPTGHLKKGTPADLVLFDLDRAWGIDVDRFRSKSRNSPFDGRPTQGQVVRTVVGGRTVFAIDEEGSV